MVKMKMEEEKCKEKKLKKGQASLPEKKNCTADDGSRAEVKKEKKKVKKVDIIIIEDESSDGGGEKKKKKRKIVIESLNDVKNGNDEEVGKKKKKKKKKNKQLADIESQVETAQSSEKEEEVEKKRRKKVKNKSVQIKPENVKIKKEEEEEQQAGNDKLPKKAKKGKNNILVVSTEETEEQVKIKKKKKKTTEAIDGISVTNLKNKAKTKVPENEVTLETPEEQTGEVEEVKVKKKKKKEAKTVGDGNEVGTPQIKGNNKKSKVEEDDMLNKKTDKSTKSEIVIVEEGKTEPKRKGKKDKAGKASVEVSEVEETEPKKKKRKRGNSKGEEEEPLILNCEEAEEQSRETLVTVAWDTTSKKSKRKKSSITVETQVENVSFETGAKKKKKIKEEVEDQQDSTQVDVVFLSEKSGNADEVAINQERRQALQMEIDEASQPQKPAKPAGFGQWSTAQFDSSDQQQKFLRLMGGFKKGFLPAAGNTGGANMALGKDAQRQLQQGLLGEFERAHSRRVDFSNRGAGLGFAAPSNKKFSIDINTCRSVRFDD